MNPKEFWVTLFGYKTGDRVKLKYDIDWSEEHEPIREGSIGLVDYTCKRFTDEEGTYEAVVVIFPYPVAGDGFKVSATLPPSWLEPI